jgi:hypothetical protein
MKPTSIMAAAILAGVSSVALAQTNSAQTSKPTNQNTAQQTDPNRLADQNARADASPKAHQGNLRQQVVSNLQQAGFTDIKATPESFLIEAKDRSGNPITMFIGPNSFAEVKTIGASTQANNTGADTNPAKSSDNKPGGAFASVPSKDELSSQVVGLNVYNNANQDIGTIKDIAFSDKGVDGYILSVGGFLGIGDHYVAVRPSAINLSFDRSNSKWRATMDTSAEQLKAAPEFKYPSNS